MATTCPSVNLKKMSKKNARITIAKDVLARLKYRKVTVGKYFEGVDNVLSYLQETPDDEGRVYLNPENLNAQKVIKLLEKQCEVCALGNLFMSHIRVFNQIELGGIENDRDGIVDSLNDYFDNQQLDLIEAAFEIEPSHVRGYLGFYREEDGKSELDKLADKAVNFGSKYDDASKRLRAIMLNLIKNDGVFVP